MRWLVRVWDILLWWFLPKRRWTWQRLDDFPQLLRERIVYLIGEEEALWQAAFQCPCRCGAILQLNLLRDERPCWAVILPSSGSITIRPSVSKLTGCKSHFLITRGQIIWAKTLRPASSNY